MADISCLNGLGLLDNEITKIYEENIAESSIVIDDDIVTYKDIYVNPEQIDSDWDNITKDDPQLSFLEYYAKEKNQHVNNVDLDNIIDKKKILDKALSTLYTDCQKRNASFIEKLQSNNFDTDMIYDWQILEEYRIIFNSIGNNMRDQTMRLNDLSITVQKHDTINLSE